MCKYRHYYYAGCRHQETILHDYCDKATSARASNSAHTTSPAATSPSSGTQTGGANDDRDATPRPGSPADISSPSPTMSSSSSSHHTTVSTVSLGSSAPTSFASTIEDTSDTASIQLDHPLRRHSMPLARDMASLPPFARDNLRQFFSGCHLPTTLASSGDRIVHHDDQENLQPIRSAEGNIPDASDRARHASYGGMASEDARLEFDAIERDIDTLKQHIAEMRSEKRSGRGTPTTRYDQTQSKLSSTRTRIPGPVVQPKESAAARLQREHEMLEQAQMSRTTSHQAKPPPPPPSPGDFPGLGRINPERRPRAVTIDTNDGKPSYANMATTGMMETVGKTSLGSQGTHGHGVGSNGTASRTTLRNFSSASKPDSAAMNQRTLGEHNETAIVSSTDPRGEHTLAARGQTSSLTARAPRFAQPTKAHNQRADASMWKESVTSKVSPIGFPTKSSHALPHLQTKRRVLPGGWLSSTEVSPATDASSPS
ncbi:hypothetical protein DOTSEDRAFT_168758, partial [Dothistroma septosporum NZE10]